MRLFLFLIGFFLCWSATAQKSGKSKSSGALSAEALAELKMAEDTLAILAYAVVNDSIEQERFGACRALITCLVRNLKTENSFKYPFERIKSVSILSPPDSSFRIFTWQLFVNDSTYRYYGAIQMNSAVLKLFPLIDRSNEVLEMPLYETFTPDKWYGALYYGIRAFDDKEGRKYLLMGYDAFSFFEKRKVIEVLHFNREGQPVFGAPVFQRSTPPAGPPEMRLMFEYAADASVRVNWDEAYGMILFDHLISMPSPYGRGFMQVPDGSYDGLKLEKGRWTYIDKVFNDVMQETPRPEPILDERKGSDIGGRPAKRKRG